MVTRKKRTEKEVEEGRVRVKRLKLNKETIKDLTGSEQKQVKGGISILSAVLTVVCPSAECRSLRGCFTTFYGGCETDKSLPPQSQLGCPI